MMIEKVIRNLTKPSKSQNLKIKVFFNIASSKSSRLNKYIHYLLHNIFKKKQDK